jgi:hypothetical protein
MPSKPKRNGNTGPQATSTQAEAGEVSVGNSAHLEWTLAKKLAWGTLPFFRGNLPPGWLARRHDFEVPVGCSSRACRADVYCCSRESQTC